ncbi:hypothetical protein V6N13_072901 [Hibiscus sabdariffa]
MWQGIVLWNPQGCLKDSKFELNAKNMIPVQVQSLPRMNIMDDIGKQRFHVSIEQTKDIFEFLAAKHCGMEELLQYCMSSAESTYKHHKSTQEHVNEIGMLLMQTSKINNARDAVKQDGLKNTDDTLQYIEGMSEQELGVTRGIVDYIKAHSKSLETFQDDHWSQASSINQRAEETFQQRYMNFDPPKLKEDNDFVMANEPTLQ